jgi:TRAP-type C4-dicarboxylate transport system substrate-binding protein
MKKIIITILSALAIVLGGQVVVAKEISVTYVAGHPPVFRWVKHVNKTFIPAVNKALEGSGHSIKWSEQYGGSLAKVGDELEAVEEGLAEMGGISSLFDPAKLAVQNVTYYSPFVSSDVDKISELMTKMQFENKDMIAAWESNGLVQVGGSIAIDDYLLMTTFPVNSLDDLKGRKIGAPGPAVTWLKGTGAVGVSGNLTTYNNEIKAGVYDGVIVFASAALPGKLHEVAPYITKIGFGAQYAGSMAANKDWFESQPEIVQKAILDAGEAYRVAYQKDLGASVNKFLSIMESQGAKVSEASPEMRKKWAAGMDNVAMEWAKKLDASGVNGTAVLKAYMDTMRSAGATPVRNWDKE